MNMMAPGQGDQSRHTQSTWTWQIGFLFQRSAMAERTARRTASATASGSRRRGLRHRAKASSTAVVRDLQHGLAGRIDFRNADQLESRVGAPARPCRDSASATETMPAKPSRRRVRDRARVGASIRSEPSL